MSKRKDAQYLHKGYLLPETIDTETSVSVCVPIPNDPNHIRAFLGQLDELGNWWTWERNSAKQGTLVARVWREVTEIVRGRIANNEDCEMVQNCCVDVTVVLHRVNPETGRLEISTDGGTTWTQDPQDPGVSAIQFQPPVTSGAAQDRCNAAANARANVQDWVEGIVTSKENTGNLIDFVVAVAIIVLAVFAEAISGGLLTSLVVPILMATMTLVYNMLTADWEAYWTNQVYDDILCAFFCAMDESGEITQAGYDNLFNDLQSTLPAGTPKEALKAMLRARGLVGVNNMATIGTGTADCTDCTCGSCDFNTWEQWDNGVILEQDEEHIKIQAVFNGTSWNAGIRNPNINSCCCDVQFVAGEGELINTIGYVPCGLSNDDQSNMSFTYVGQLANGFALAATAAFTATITGNNPFECGG
jgi:hypothetical protein